MDKVTDSNNLLRRIIEEKVNSALDEPLSKLIGENESQDVEEIIKKLDLKTIEDDILRDTQRSSRDPWTVNLNHSDYATVIEGLNTTSTVTKIKILDKLLDIQIIDTKQQLWEELSQSLRKCFVSANNEIFIRTLKVHHRIIIFPNTSCDGYLNLLKSTFLLLNSRYFTDLNKTRILQSLQLIVDTHNFVIKFLLHASRNVIDEILLAFINVLSFKSVFELFGTVDPKTNWMSNFCYGTHVRTTFFSHLKRKNPEFIKHIVVTFTKKLSNVDDDSEAFYGYFLTYFWRYKENLTFLLGEISAETTLAAIITKLKNRKNKQLTKLIIDLFNHNPTLLKPKLLNMLMEPLSSSNRNNTRNTIERNAHVFTIMINMAKSPNFRVLFGVCVHKGRRRQLTRNCTNLLQKIVDLTTTSLKLYSNQNQNEHYCCTTAYLLLSCCVALYEAHPVTLLHVNPSKLVCNLRDFYHLNWRNDDNVRDAALRLFTFFYSNYEPSLKILGYDNEILGDLFTFTPIEDLKVVVNKLGCDKDGISFLKSHRAQIVKPYLEQIWLLDENDNNDFAEFILFLVQLNAGSIIALLVDDDDENTVVSGGRSVSLVELLEKSLNNWGEPVEEYVGLLVIKVMMMNLDLLLYLQANYQVQEKLESLAEYDENIIIDALTSFRRNIRISLELIGFAENKYKSQVGESADLAMVPQIFEVLKPTSENNEFKTFLENGFGKGDLNWLAGARRTFKNSLDLFDPSVLVTLLEQIPKAYVYRKVELQWPPTDSVYYQLHPEDFCGLSLIINYGLKTGLLSMVEDDIHNKNLMLLLKQSRVLLGHQPQYFANFDWFVGIVFLICCGNLDHCKSILMNFTNMQATPLVWTTFGKEFDSTLQETFYQHLAVMLEENGTSFQALKMLGISTEMLVRSWLNQCFFDLLRFEEICNFIVFTVLYSADCLLCYIVAIFNYLNERICSVTHSPQMNNIFQMTEMSGFRLSEHIHLIEKLIKRHRNLHRL